MPIGKSRKSGIRLAPGSTYLSRYGAMICQHISKTTVRSSEGETGCQILKNLDCRIYSSGQSAAKNRWQVVAIWDAAYLSLGTIRSTWPQ